MKLYRKLFPLPLFAILVHPAHSAETPAAEPLMEQVVVSGSRSATRLSDTPLAIGSVDRAILERDKPKTMGEAINRIAGVYWNDLGNEQHGMSIRQPIGTNAVYQYLEDGIPIRPLGVFNHNSLNEVNLAGSDAVEVVKGPASSLYGSNAVGGAINFLTAAPARGRFASVGLRHDNTAGFTRLDTSAGDRWGALGLRFSHYSSRRSANNWQQYSNGDKDSFTVRGDYTLSATSLLRASLVHTDLDTATSGSVFENDFRNNPGKSINSFSYRRDKTTRATVAWEGDTVQHGVSTLTLFSRRNDHGQLPSYTISGCAGAACKGTLNNSHVASIGVDLKHQQEFHWLASRLVAGVYLDRSENPYFSDNLDIVRDPASGRYLRYTVSSATTPLGVRDYQADIDNRAVFAQWEFSPAPRTRVVVGARNDAIGYDFHNRLSPAGSVNYGAPDETRRFSHLSPKVGATYTLSRTANLYVNVSEGFTPPEVSQLYGKTGIPELDPATYNNYELGWRVAFLDGKLKLDSALYRLAGRDTVVSYTVAPGVSENRNAGRTRSQGLEFGINYDGAAFDARFGTAIASHRYLRYQVSGTLDYSGMRMPQAPRDVTSAELGYRPGGGVRLAIEAVHLGSYWMNNANTVKYAGHALLNLRAAWQVNARLEAWAQVRNASDRHYADSASSSYGGAGAYTPNAQNQYTPGAPRSLMLGLAYRFAAN